ncbi:hypothetical protein J7E91_09105 [Streptomyces sp. ISL-99]|nr:hypothetical protein [Streptomyces sp. ISL-99]MBT2525587.1 hypothetical protein [Streptomyces sp. ISL-99]
MGQHHYGRLSGLLAAPTTAASALAPFADAAVAVPMGGYSNVFGLLALIAGLAAVVALGTGSRRTDQR